MESPENLLGKVLDTEKLKYCYECGICTASCPMAELLPKLYNPRSLLQRIWFDHNKVLTEKEIWLCAWCYRCYKKCPQGLRLPEVFLSMKDLVAERGYFDGFMEALKIIRKEVPLPVACCYVCFHPGRGSVDKSPVVSILKRFFADYPEKKKEKKLAREVHKEKIAIVGSGPAGLTAGYELVRKGYFVTIFESLPEPGGMLRAGIPEFRLPKSVVNAEIEHVRNLGVEIRTNVLVGKDVTIEGLLRKGYRAIFIATGTHKSRRLRVEGEELEGVFDALSLLKKTNMGIDVKLGKRLAVIGGGNVAVDASRVALRLGTEEVNILYRRSREEMPANPWEVKEAENEGVKIQFLVTPRKILGKNGRATAIECVRMELGEPDMGGRRSPVPIPGSEFVMETDTIILAIGEEPDLSILPQEIKVTESKTIAANPFTLQTSLTGVFAGGDVVSGPATVIEAIVAGKRAAASIDRYLTEDQGQKE
ncbi:MAG: FAD-dependent oxidoreductase [Candidatus Bathyarchaeaceae archaeon]